MPPLHTTAGGLVPIWRPSFGFRQRRGHASPSRPRRDREKQNTLPGLAGCLFSSDILAVIEVSRVACLPHRERVTARLTERPGWAHNALAGALCLRLLFGKVLDASIVYLYIFCQDKCRDIKNKKKQRARCFFLLGSKSTSFWLVRQSIFIK